MQTKPALLVRSLEEGRRTFIKVNPAPSLIPSTSWLRGHLTSTCLLTMTRRSLPVRGSSLGSSSLRALVLPSGCWWARRAGAEKRARIPCNLPDRCPPAGCPWISVISNADSLQAVGSRSVKRPRASVERSLYYNSCRGHSSDSRHVEECICNLGCFLFILKSFFFF